MQMGLEKYLCLEELGDGTCGSVYKAVNIQSKEVVAIKKLKRKFYSWDECMNQREVKILWELKHPNIIKLKEIFGEHNELFFIFECMENNLYQVIKNRQRPFLETEIRGFLSQILLALDYIHKSGYFHRDLKPENILVTNELVKIADFGLAREITSGPPYTEYVSTRWYRAPEVLLQFSSYSPAIDMWAVGAILAELFTLSPLFPGESEIDQMHKICYILGSPDFNTWPDGFRLSQTDNFRFVQTMPMNLADVIPNASSFAINLIMRLCSWDPQRRPTAEEALQHPFFHVGTWIPYPVRDPPQFLADPANRDLRSLMGEEPRLELNLWDFGARSDECFLGLTLGGRPSVSRLNDARQADRQRDQEEMLFRSEIQDHPAQSVFWPLMSSNYEVGESSSRAPPPSPYLPNSPRTFAADRQTGRLSGHGFRAMQYYTYFE